MDKELSNVKKIIESFPKGRERVNRLTWGSYIKEPDSWGVISVNGYIFVYNFNSRCLCMFQGPMNEKEAIAFIGICILGINVGEYSLEQSDFLRIMNMKSYSLEEVENLVKKRVLDDQKAVISSHDKIIR